jgi:hypothetical protein
MLEIDLLITLDRVAEVLDQLSVECQPLAVGSFSTVAMSANAAQNFVLAALLDTPESN